MEATTPHITRIDQLPIELLLAVFARVDNDQTALDNRLRRSPFNLLQVNQHWRAAALSASWLWAALEFPYVKIRDHRRALIDLCISRIAPFPDADLHLSLESVPFIIAPKRDCSTFTTFLRSRRAHWRSLYLEPLNEGSEAILFKRLRVGDVERLREATLHGEPMNWERAEMAGLATIIRVAENLEHLTLHWVCLPPSLASVPHLRFLDISNCVQDNCMPLSSIAANLSGMKNLEILRISTRLWRRRDTVSGVRVRLPALHTLSVRTPPREPRLVVLLDLLDASGVKHLQFQLEPSGLDDTPDDLWAPAVLRKQWPLETLDVLAEVWQVENFSRVLRAHPSITCLVVDYAALQMLVQSEEDGTPLCPLLDDLCVLMGEQHTSLVLSFARLRLVSTGCKPLGQVRLLPDRYMRKPTDYSSPIVPSDRDALMDLVEVYTTWHGRPEAFRE